MSQRQSDRTARLRVGRDQPLIAIPVVEGEEEVTYSFEDEEAAEVSQRGVDARTFAGAWSDPDWEETIEALERIRHESKPTPSIDDLL